jgi:hypothetical protein
MRRQSPLPLRRRCLYWPSLPRRLLLLIYHHQRHQQPESLNCL